MSNLIKIFDTTLRDGEQTPGVSLGVAEKVEIAKQLARLQVDIIEAGFPVASRGEVRAIQQVAKEVRGPIITALARCNRKEVDICREALAGAEHPRVHIFIATSDIHLQYKLKQTKKEVLEAACDVVAYARRFFPEVQFSPEDGGSGRTDPAYLMEIIEKVIDAGANIINIPDTVGYQTPALFGSLIRQIKEEVPNIDKATISVHCHNDLGLAVANSLAAIENGARQVETAINGIGERAGNASLEEIVMALATRPDYYNCVTNIDTTHIYRTSRLISKLTGVPIQPNKAIVGANAFAHESGIHQDGVLKKRETYEIMTPESIGLSSNSLVLGKHSGRHALKIKLQEMGFSLSQEDVNAVFSRFKELADQKKVITDQDIEALVEDKISTAPAYYHLESFHVATGSQIAPTATLKLICGDKTYEEAAVGDGPVDAIYKAIDRITGHDVILDNYSISAVTREKEALGEAHVRIKANGLVANGRGTSTDVLEASTLAYIDALNKLIIRGGNINGHDYCRKDISSACQQA
ncbi:MAG: 2-isopropylmalate synthase [bacterium]